MSHCVIGCTCGKHNYPKNRKSRVILEETRRKIAESLRGVKHSEERRSNISESLKGRVGPNLGKSMSKEQKQKLSESMTGKAQSAEAKQRKSAALVDYYSTEEHRFKRSLELGGSGDGTWVSKEGYVQVYLPGHPLSNQRGWVARHRAALYDSIGTGPHLCNWGCGKVLNWGGLHGICADHLNDIPGDDRPENLVPSCRVCNWHREGM